jgi:predicted DNA-binding ribbon-helix-helix protein
VAKRSLTIAGHRTSVSLEEPFWTALAEIAVARRTSVSALVASIDGRRPAHTNLSAAVRVFILDWYRASAARQRATSS